MNTLLLFTATWCGPCQQVKRWINDYAANYTIEIVDVEQIDAKSYGIKSVPALIFLDSNKQEYGRLVGKDVNKTKIDETLQNFN